MVFSSPLFLFLFLPVVLLVYVGLVNRRAQNLWLLVASLLFYAWGEQGFVLVMLASIVFNYAMGLLVAGTRQRPWVCRCGLILAVAGNLGMLGFYKYAGFLVDNTNALLAGAGLTLVPSLSVHLPIGISFFTFQALSYVIDVYRQEVVARRNPLDVGLYISMFPQLIAGPIVRYRDVAAEIERRLYSLDGFVSGIRMFTVGLGKKMILANTFSRVADGVFAMPTGEVPAAAAWTGLVAYTLQIYFDFAGYSDMAIGLGRMLGFHFPINFNYPYISRSIRDFWQRWHISLSSWLRDYLYIPLGGSRRSRVRTYLNLVVVFLLCGLWHGASWNFAVWGLFHGGFLVLERAMRPPRPVHLPGAIRHMYVLLVVMVGWVFFRTETLADALRFLTGMVGAHGWSSAAYPARLWWDTPTLICLAVAIPACTPLFVRLRFQSQTMRAGHWAERLVPLARRIAECGGLLVIWGLSAMLLAKGTHNPFIYFRF
ncbi:MAG: MBOAT family protein [Lentisphaerae bacterium]|nr:MBOAT family protein [Lentisphaerota bacterium]